MVICPPFQSIAFGECARCFHSGAPIRQLQMINVVSTMLIRSSKSAVILLLVFLERKWRKLLLDEIHRAEMFALVYSAGRCTVLYQNWVTVPEDNAQTLDFLLYYGWLLYWFITIFCILHRIWSCRELLELRGCQNKRVHHPLLTWSEKGGEGQK